MSNLNVAYSFEEPTEKNKKINKLLWRPEHSRQEITPKEKNNLKEFESNNPELLMPQDKNEFYNFNEPKNNIQEVIIKENNDDEIMSMSIEDILKEDESNVKQEISQVDIEQKVNDVIYVDQDGYQFKYVNEDNIDDTLSIYSDEDGNQIQYLNNDYKTELKKEEKENISNDGLKYNSMIKYLLLALLIFFIIKRFKS